MIPRLSINKRPRGRLIPRYAYYKESKCNKEDPKEKVSQLYSRSIGLFAKKNPKKGKLKYPGLNHCKAKSC